MAESLDISIDLHMPDGGKPVTQSCDHGLPLADTNPKNPLRKEILKLTKSLLEVSKSEASAGA
jgi:pilus assembly protein CpaE